MLTARRIIEAKLVCLDVRLILFFLIGLLSTVSTVYGRKISTLPTEIIIDESVIIRKIPKELFGFNHNWIVSERRLWNREQKRIADDFVDRLAGLRMPLNRMSGAESQFFHWKYAIGPMRDRIEQEMVTGGERVKRMFGPVEWVKSTIKIDPDAKFSWVFNMEKERPADHADLVEFLVADGTVNINGGINWAEKRIRLGLPKPVKVSIWELGNELDFKKGRNHWAVDRYIDESRKVIAAVRSVDPGAKIAAHAASAPWVKKRYRGRDWRDWHRKVLREIGSQIDFISFHPYYLGVPTSEIESYLDEINRDILRITGQSRIKIFISEHAVWPSRAIFAGNGTADWYQTHSLAGVLATAQFLNRLMGRREVEAAAYHCFSGGPWGVVYKSEITGQLYTTGIFSLYKLFGSFAGMDVVRTTVIGKEADVHGATLKFTVSAAKKTDFLLIAGVNRDEYVPRDATFTLKGQYRLVKVVTLTGDSLQSHDDEYGKNVRVSGRYFDSTKNLARFTFPPRSICFLLLRVI